MQQSFPNWGKTSSCSVPFSINHVLRWNKDSFLICVYVFVHMCVEVRVSLGVGPYLLPWLFATMYVRLGGLRASKNSSVCLGFSFPTGVLGLQTWPTASHPLQECWITDMTHFLSFSPTGALDYRHGPLLPILGLQTWPMGPGFHMGPRDSDSGLHAFKVSPLSPEPFP